MVVRIVECLPEWSFFFQAEDVIRYAQESRGLGDVYMIQLFQWEMSCYASRQALGDPRQYQLFQRFLAQGFR